MTIPIPPDEALLNAYTKEKECLHADRLRAVATLAAKQAAEQAVKEALHKFYGLLVMNEGLGAESFAVAREMLCHYFPSPLTPTPPKEQPVTQTAAAPRDFHIGSAQRVLAGDADGLFDFVPWSGTPQGHKFWSATYAEMEAGKPLRAEAREIIEGWLRASGVVATPSPDPATVRMCIETMKANGFNEFDVTVALKPLLPKPTPAPEPERYVTVEEVADAMKDIGGTLVDSRCAVLSRLDKHAAKRGPMLKESDARRIALNANAMPDTPQDEILAALRRAAKGGEGK